MIFTCHLEFMAFVRHFGLSETIEYLGAIQAENKAFSESPTLFPMDAHRGSKGNWSSDRHTSTFEVIRPTPSEYPEEQLELDVRCDYIPYASEPGLISPLRYFCEPGEAA